LRGARHCEERSDAAIQEHALDCFATLAMTKYLILALAVFVSACRDERPPAPSAEQARQLNEAENMLDNMAVNEKGPADRSTGPSKKSD
jgi:hypothetical protein